MYNVLNTYTLVDFRVRANDSMRIQLQLAMMIMKSIMKW